MFVQETPLPFRDIVTEEFLRNLRNREVGKAVKQTALYDDQMATGFNQVHLASQTVMVGARGWLSADMKLDLSEAATAATPPHQSPAPPTIDPIHAGHREGQPRPSSELRATKLIQTHRKGGL